LTPGTVPSPAGGIEPVAVVAPVDGNPDPWSVETMTTKGDYPRGVLSITDNGGATIDRYSVVFAPEKIHGESWYSMITMSPRPSHPQGVGCSSMHQHRPHRAAGERTIAFASLPAECRRVVEDYLRA
jgi:hypothetical protein